MVAERIHSSKASSFVCVTAFPIILSTPAGTGETRGVFVLTPQYKGMRLST